VGIPPLLLLVSSTPGIRWSQSPASIGRVSTAGRSGVEMRLAQVWTCRDGLGARMEMYADRKEALEAAGLRESFYAALVMFSRSARLAFSSAVKVTDLVFVRIEISFAGTRNRPPAVEPKVRSSISSAAGFLRSFVSIVRWWVVISAKSSWSLMRITVSLSGGVSESITVTSVLSERSSACCFCSYTGETAPVSPTSPA
jgi:hypothetical protein